MCISYWILQVNAYIGHTSIPVDYQLVVMEMGSSERVAVSGFNHSRKGDMVIPRFVLVVPSIVVVAAAVAQHTVLV